MLCFHLNQKFKFETLDRRSKIKRNPDFIVGSYFRAFRSIGFRDGRNASGPNTALFPMLARDEQRREIAGIAVQFE